MLALEPSWDMAATGDAEEQPSSPVQMGIFIRKPEC